MASIGTFIYTALFGRPIGRDEFGNRYFQSRRRTSYGRPLRWVLYARKDDGSAVPPGWHAWLHHSRDEPPSEEPLVVQRWEKPHLPNLTGTVAAYRARGHDLSGGRRAPATGDYEPWRPE